MTLFEQIDITVLRKLAEVTNVVPVIAKSDSLTLQEREAFKERVRLAMSSNHQSLRTKAYLLATYR
jgi:septin family protein